MEAIINKVTEILGDFNNYNKEILENGDFTYTILRCRKKLKVFSEKDDLLFRSLGVEEVFAELCHKLEQQNILPKYEDSLNQFDEIEEAEKIEFLYKLLDEIKDKETESISLKLVRVVEH